MTGQVLNLNDFLQGQTDELAISISNIFREWNQLRQTWINQKKELRNYLFATDTTTTTNSANPWKNKTTVPKLTQIRDNLHANYMEALFPHADWLSWEGVTGDDQQAKKVQSITAYMKTKLRQSNAEVEVGKILLDYIDYGNCFATCEWVDESLLNPVTGEEIRGYVGPKIVRISPYDLVFNPLAPDFESSPKMIRSISTIGDLAKKASKLPPESVEAKLYKAALDKTLNIRQQIKGLSTNDQVKGEGFQIDGFSDIRHYYQSDYVEVITFYGDMFDVEKRELLENHIVTIIDRGFVIAKRPNPNWITNGGFRHAGWRQRPDNLYAMGPLDNLVGMQYRMDHLENLKADVFDFIAFPVQKVKGYVQDYVYGPGERIYCGDDGDVEFMHPDGTALQAETQIEELERRMEQLAGAPKEAMGIRTPGEKTKFEVQILDNAASRIFMNKIKHFEQTCFEKLLNDFLVLARQNMTGSDVVRTLDRDVDAVIFSEITKDDLTANGQLRPRGASHFAHRANQLQNLLNILNTQVAMDPDVKVHTSGKKIAKLLEDLGEFGDFKLYGDNVRIIERGETAKLTAQVQEQVQMESNTSPGVLPHDVTGGQSATGTNPTVQPGQQPEAPKVAR